ncbi:hypothetical protein [Salipaludibacillus daqingensis]|uniref:hypothetical protein n=1 Tax=Salipaludibacillus daqingensis TaxID=3041001 RepID=UPI00247645B0|nr:hypothetical protein [Salipaludibacillus daqingensis]
MSLTEDIVLEYEWKGTKNNSLHVLYQGEVCMCYKENKERIATCNRDELITFMKELKEGHYAR